MDNLNILRKLDDLSNFRRAISRSLNTSALHLSINKTQKQVLMAILRTTENNMTDLSEQIGLEKSTLTRTVDSLIEEGLVTRSPGIQDRRTITCALTEKGQAIANQLDQLMRDHLESILSGLSENERIELNEKLSDCIRLMKSQG
ncbi:MAG: MarR family winged helix-turn-helix transcriptional regulator [Christensenellales bacterium]|jgi:DNA-binding MarR family transcriptional regulator